MLFTRDAEIALTEAYQPQGINVGINLGRPPAPASSITCTSTSCRAGPATRTSCRWSGNTRVLPEDLGETARRLRPIFERLQRDRR